MIKLTVKKSLVSVAVVVSFFALCTIGITRLPIASVSAASSNTEDGFKVTTVFVVRHAEKASRPSEDPVLNEEGKVRAERLSEVLQSAGIKEIYTSQFQRTKLTAEPLARRLGISVGEVPLKMDQDNPRMVSQDSIKAIVDKIYEHAGSAILVVGHSNTIPELIRMLGGDLVPTLGEKEYDDIFMATIYQRGKSKVIRLKYGQPNQP